MVERDFNQFNLSDHLEPTEVDVQHGGIGAFDDDPVARLGEGFVHVRDAVLDEGLQQISVSLSTKVKVVIVEAQRIGNCEFE